MSTDKKIPESLLDQINQQFSYYGFRSPSMDDLAKELGISKKTLYKYADNKEDVIIQSLDAQLKKPSEAPKNFNDLFDYLVGQLRLFSLSSIQDLKIYYPSAYALYSAYRDQYIPNYLSEQLSLVCKLGENNQPVNLNFLSAQLPNWIEIILFNQIGDPDQMNMELNDLRDFVIVALTKPTGN